MPTRNHILITGTGRSGTTFLVELLTNLNLDTRYSKDNLDDISHGGLEHDLRNDDCPFIVKDPWFCDYAEEVLSRNDIVIEHIFIPIRDLHAAAESRRHVSRQNRLWGGLWHTQSHEAGRQEVVLMHQLYKLFLAISGTMIPVTLMRYPRITKDCSYLFSKLEPVLSGISYEVFSTEFNKTVRPEFVHSFNDNDR